MTDCTQECREYVARLMSPTEVALKWGVTIRQVNTIGRRLNLGIFVAGGRLYPPEDVLEMERHRATRKYGPGKTPRTRAEQIEAAPREPVILGGHYLDALRKLRGERT